MKKWILVDSDGGVYAKYNNKLLDFLETRKLAKEDKKIFMDITNNKRSQRMKYNINLYSRTNFLLILNNKDIFNIHQKFKNPIYILKYIFLDTKEEVKGIQSNKPTYKILGNKEII